MKIALRERALATTLIVPTALVVIVLAVLQYRWSNQVSNATSVRLADSLQMSMINWHLNFFRDLSDICAAMRMDMRMPTESRLSSATATSNSSSVTPEARPRFIAPPPARSAGTPPG